jgi:hypothetical protein
MFGHKVKLNFKKNNKTHKTYFGAVMSMIVIIIILNMIVHKFYLMISKGDNTMNSYSSLNVKPSIDSLESAGIEGIRYNETKLTLYHVLKKRSWNDGPVYLTKDNARHFDIFFTTTVIDWKKTYRERIT